MRLAILVLAFIFFLLCSPSDLTSQDYRTEVVLKISESSGFLGLGKPRFVTIALASFDRSRTLTMENVNGGDAYYFILDSGEDWGLDEDFVKNALPLLQIAQGERRWKVEQRDSVIYDRSRYSVRIGFSKQMSLHEPLLFSYPLSNAQSTVTMMVPQEYWQGFRKITRLSATAESGVNQNDLKSAIAAYTEILRDKSLQVFPTYAEASAGRISAYQRLFRETMDASIGYMVYDTLELKKRIQSLSTCAAAFKFVADSIDDPMFKNENSEQVMRKVKDDARSKYDQGILFVDSLKEHLDTQTVKWIVQGSTAGPTDFRYRLVVEALAYGFLSTDFRDFDRLNIKPQADEKRNALLKKFNLLESYDTFVRMAQSRRKKGLPLFPQEFLITVRNDSAQFSAPYFAMLRSIQEYYNANLAEAARDANYSMSRTSDEQLALRIDEFRLSVEARKKALTSEVTNLLVSGYKAENSGQYTSAVEQYKDAVTLQPDYAPASFALGRAFEKMGEGYKAINYFQKAVTLDPNYFTAFHYLRLAAMRSGNISSLVPLFQASVSKGNASYLILTYLAEANNSGGSYREALTASDRAIALNPKAIPAFLQGGIAHQNLHSITKAREYFAKATQIDPENNEAIECMRALDTLTQPKAE